MLTLNPINNEGEKNQALISLYKKSDFSFDYKLAPDINKEDKILYYDNNYSSSESNETSSEDNDNDDNNFIFINDLNLNGVQYVPYPYFDKKNIFFKMLICGASGVGKSTLFLNICKMMLNATNNNLFVLYYTPNNIDLPIQKYFKKIFNGNCLMITPDLIKKSIEHNIKSLKDNSKKIKLIFTLEDMHKLQKEKNQQILCVYDDCEGCPEKNIKDVYLKSMNEVLVMGRARDKKNQSNISCIVINHKPLQGMASSNIFNEASFIALHIKSISTIHLKEILLNKMGYDNTTIKQILKLRKLNAGMCIFSKSYPYHIMVHGDNPAVILQL